MLPAALPCEILAPTRHIAAELAAIVRTCGHDLHQPLTILPRVAADAPPAPVITLLLPVEFAASQHPAWCLACRLACFCPQARVSVLVQGESTFRAPRAGRRTASARLAAPHVTAA